MFVYKVPSTYKVRLHHVRPRFKNNIENVLVFMANEVCDIGFQPKKDFDRMLDQSIRNFPGNSKLTDKTIANWRTEISALLGLTVYLGDKIGPSKMAEHLSRSQDLIEFFKYFCFKFQYPGGHLKPASSLEMIKKGVKFKPAQYIIRILRYFQSINEKPKLSKEEVTHCLFNDLRVCRDNIDVSATASLILENRINNVVYDSQGDVVRYAGDIMDYMVLADILEVKYDGSYYLKGASLEYLHVLENDQDYFSGYEHLYKSPETVHIDSVKQVQKLWFDYVNSGLNEETFKTDLSKVFADAAETDNETPNVISEILTSFNTKRRSSSEMRTIDIGNAGESIAIHHEKTRLINLQREDLAKKVVKVPEALAAGYDLNSYEGISEIKRLVEVKTTISKNKLSVQRFSMTPTEWGAAESFKDRYFIYRLMISDNDVSLFIIQDPVGLYKKDLIKMTPRDGVSISYDANAGAFAEVLS